VNFINRTISHPRLDAYLAEQAGALPFRLLPFIFRDPLAK